MDEAMAIILGAVLLFVASPFFGAESRPEWKDPSRKPRFKMVGSMRPKDWPPS